MKELITQVQAAAAAYETAQHTVISAPCKGNVDALCSAHKSLRDAVKQLSDALNTCTNEPAK